MTKWLFKKQYHWGYFVIFLSLLGTFGIYFGSMALYEDWYDYHLLYFAKIGSLGATILICWAFLLATRFRFVERFFGGLDKVYKAHRKVGEASFILILLHPLFLSLDPKYQSLQFFSLTQLPSENLTYYLARITGMVAFLAFVVLMGLTFSPLRYDRWKQTHNFFGLFLVFVILHALIAKGEIIAYPLLTLWFAGWLLLALFCYLYIRLLYRWFGPLYDYSVDHVKKLGDIVEIYMQPRHPRRKLSHRPGQFIYIYFTSPDLSAEQHPFSISSAPQEEHLRISVKELGDWTEKTEKLQKGERAFLWGPYGKFGDHIYEYPDKEAVLIGGGIGITPFLSMVEDKDFLAGKRGTIYLIYSVEKPHESYYHDEIATLAQRFDHFHYLPHCSEESGYLSADQIKDLVGGKLSGKIFLLCGPKPMMDTLVAQLLETDVPFKHVFTEDFNIK